MKDQKRPEGRNRRDQYVQLDKTTKEQGQMLYLLTGVFYKEFFSNIPVNVAELFFLTLFK